MKFWFCFLNFTEILKSYAIDTFTKSAVVSLLSIKLTYLVLWVDS